MKKERISRYFPVRHQKVFILLITDILKFGLSIRSPRRISSSESRLLSDFIYLETGALFSGKQLQKFAQEISEGKVQIVKPRPGTLNLLAQFVDWKTNGKPAIVNRTTLNQYWLIYLQSHLTNKKTFDGLRISTVEKKWQTGSEQVEPGEVKSVGKEPGQMEGEQTEDAEVSSEDAKPVQMKTGQVEFLEIISEKKYSEIVLVKNYLPHETLKEMNDIYDMYVPNKFDIPEINRRHRFASLLGGALVGVINALLLILLPPIITGYVTVHANDKTLLSALITCTNISCGSIGGFFVCGLFGKPVLYDKSPIINWKEKAILVILTSIIMITFRQLASRVFIEKRIFDTSIDLETICYCITSSIGIIAIVKLMRSNYIIAFSELIKSVALTTLKVLLTLTCFVSVYLFFIHNSDIDKIRIPSDSRFQIVIDFPQSGRIILVSLMNLLNMFTWVIVRNIYYKLS